MNACFMLAVLSVYPDGRPPYSTIQDAVNAAVDGDEIHLTQDLGMGIDSFMGPGNREIDLQGKAIMIKPYDDDAEHAVISTDDPSSSHTVFILDDDEGRDTIFENITFRFNVCEEGDSSPALISIQGTSPTIRNCSFNENEGLCIYSANGAPLIEGSAFTENSALTRSTSIVAWGGAAEIRNCQFTDNSAGDVLGGAVFLYQGTMTHCEFANNRALYGIGGSLALGELGVVEDTILQAGEDPPSQCTVATYGGVMKRCSIYGDDFEYGDLFDQGPAVIVLVGTRCLQLIDCDVELIYDAGGCYRVRNTLPTEELGIPLRVAPESWGAIKEKYR